MEEKTDIIKKACEMLLNSSKIDALTLINDKYRFSCPTIIKRHYSEADKLRIFIRDGFIDRYSGKKLLVPSILKVLSFYFPKDFPYQEHWKMSETHIAYWELIPTIDHILPISVGGENSMENCVTTSMKNNSIKSNWTLDQLGWKLYTSGSNNDWDGLIGLFIQIVDNDKDFLKDNYIRRWYNLIKAMTTEDNIY